MLIDHGEGVLPTVWAPSAEEDFFYKVLEACEPGIKEEVACMGSEELAESLVAMVRKHQIPQHFRKFEFTADKKKKFDELNSYRSRKAPWDYSMLEGGYEGAIWDHNNEVKVMDELETKKLAARVVAWADRKKR
jgi:hypothetical protein